jgi:hypothetical protein
MFQSVIPPGCQVRRQIKNWIEYHGSIIVLKTNSYRLRNIRIMELVIVSSPLLYKEFKCQLVIGVFQLAIGFEQTDQDLIGKGVHLM